MQKENKASEVILFKTAKHEFQDCSRIGSAPREESKAGGQKLASYIAACRM